MFNPQVGSGIGLSGLGEARVSWPGQTLELSKVS